MYRLINSLRRRIVLATTVSTLVVFLGVGHLVVTGVRRDERAALDARLQQQAARLASFPAIGRTELVPGGMLIGGTLLAAGERGLRVVRDGRLIRAAGELPVGHRSALPTSTGMRTFTGADQVQWRSATASVAGDPSTLVEVVAPVSQVQNAVRSLRRRLLIVGLIGLAVALGLATLAANYAVRALSRLRSAAEDVASTDRLTLRVPDGGPSEVHAVVQALNTMLDRVERSAMERERALKATRQFAADAGHELRTPLAVLQTSLDTLARNPDLPAAERAEIVADTLAEHRRLSELVSALQSLTRGDGGLMGDERAIDFRGILDAAIAGLQRDHPDAQVTTHTSGSLPPLIASPIGLRLLIDNLLQNAARYGSVAGLPAVIRVTALPAGRGVALCVEDDGPGIPVSERERVTARFVRGSASAASEGSGLGLAIVVQQVERLGGTLLVEESPSGGARFSATLCSLAVANVGSQPS